MARVVAEQAQRNTALRGFLLRRNQRGHAPALQSRRPSSRRSPSPPSPSRARAPIPRIPRDSITSRPYPPSPIRRAPPRARRPPQRAACSSARTPADPPRSQVARPPFGSAPNPRHRGPCHPSSPPSPPGGAPTHLLHVTLHHALPTRVARIKEASTCTTSALATFASTHERTVTEYLPKPTLSPPLPDPRQARMIRQLLLQPTTGSRGSCASRINRRSCANPSRRPASIRTATSGSIPGRPLSAQYNPTPPRAANSGPEPGSHGPVCDPRDSSEPVTNNSSWARFLRPNISYIRASGYNYIRS